MKLPIVLFGLLLGMCVVMGVALLSDPPKNNHGFAHSRFGNSMLQGGDGQLRHGSIRWLGWIYGGCQIVFYVICLLLGMREPSRCTRAFLVCGGIYLGTFCWLMLADQKYVGHLDQPLVLGFPLSTAIMVYGLWGVPLLFVGMYVVNFDRWILKPDDLQRFEDLVRQKREGKESGE